MNDQFIQGIIFDWNKIDDDSYLKQIEALKDVERLEFQNSINFFVGENGSGKSTLLEAIAIAYGFNPEGGTKNYVFSTHDTHSELCDAIRVVKGYRKEKWGYFLRAESFYNVATKEEEYGGIDSARYHERSHGEGFLALAQNNLQHFNSAEIQNAGGSKLYTSQLGSSTMALSGDFVTSDGQKHISSEDLMKKTDE